MLYLFFIYALVIALIIITPHALNLIVAYVILVILLSELNRVCLFPGSDIIGKVFCTPGRIEKSKIEGDMQPLTINDDQLTQVEQFQKEINKC